MGGMIYGMALCAGGGGLEAGLHLVLPGYRLICAVERQAYAAACLVEWMEPRVAAEPGLGGAAYGVGDRAEQLHLLGNGVVPVVAALAFVTLWQRLCPINSKG